MSVLPIDFGKKDSIFIINIMRKNRLKWKELLMGKELDRKKTSKK